MTFCQLRINKWYYKRERLEEFCVMKVKLFNNDEMVR
jgi:hypothetical protein